MRKAFCIKQLETGDNDYKLFVLVEDVARIGVREHTLTGHTEPSYRVVFYLKDGRRLQERGFYDSEEAVCKKVERFFEKGEWVD